MREKENNLRNHLTRLEQAGLFRWVHKEVDKDWEIGSITRLVFSGVSEQNRYSIGFSRIRGYAGMRVVAGVVGGSKRILSRVLGVEPDAHQIHARWSESQNRPIPSRLVDKGPCKENSLKALMLTCTSCQFPCGRPARMRALSDAAVDHPRSNRSGSI